MPRLPADSTVADEQKSIKLAVEAGKKILWAMQYEQDISAVVNSPFYLGSRQKVEFTAELVPAWQDSDLVPDESENYLNLFLEEVELADLDNPNQYSYYKYYHAKGSSFKRHVGQHLGIKRIRALQ